MGWVLQTPRGDKEHPTAKGCSGQRCWGGSCHHWGAKGAQPEQGEVTPGQLQRGWSLDLPAGKRRDSRAGTLGAPAEFPVPSPSFWGSALAVHPHLKVTNLQLPSSGALQIFPASSKQSLIPARGDVRGDVGHPQHPKPGLCQLQGPQGCCWYWPSVAVKKSSSTLFMKSKVGRSSGLSFQHCLISSYSSGGQLSGCGIR